MADATTFADFTTDWEYYLYRIERIWERTEKTYKKQKGFQQWFAPYQKLRKKDPLLRYLKQARNSETHSLDGSLKVPLSISIKERYGRDFNIKSMSSKFEDKCLTISLESGDLFLDLDTKILTKTPYVVRIKNRGRWFNTPCSHLGNILNETNPIILGRLGLDFYKALVFEASKNFE